MDVPSYLLGKKKGGGGTTSLQNKTVEITGNGITTVSADAGYDGLRNVEIDTDVQPTLQTKSQTITTNTTTTITADNDYDGLSSVEITTNIPQPSGEISITENGSYNVSDYASASVNVSTSSEDDDSDLINFYDYDGTLVDSVRLSELPLSELPTPPAHEGLTFEKWNWTLADINALTYAMDVGALYTTTSGATELYFENISKLMLNLGSDTAGTTSINNLYIDWGDGTTELYDVYGKIHTYEHIGDYVVKITPVSNNFNYALQGSSSSSGTSFIGKSSDRYVYHLKEVRLGSNCTKLTNYTFYYCYVLQKISLHSNCTIAQSSANVDYKVFENCSSLTYLVLPPTQVYVNNIFSGCYSLKGVSFPKEFTSAKYKLFYWCYSLKRICVSTNCTDLGYISTCLSLKSIYTDSNNTLALVIEGTAGQSDYHSELKKTNFSKKLGSKIFSGNNDIDNLSDNKYKIISSTATSMDNEFRNCYSLENASKFGELCPDLTTMDYCFYSCNNLKNITLPSSLTKLTSYNFSGCYKLENIIIPSSVTNIGPNNFSACYSLKNITIPSNVTVLGANCFQSCYNLKTVTFLGQISNIQTNTFYLCISVVKYDFTNSTAVPSLANTNAITVNADTKIVVPDDLYETWIGTTNWSTYASYIVKESEYND